MKSSAKLIAFSVVFAACGDPAAPDVTPAKVELTAAATTVQSGASIQLSSVVKNAAGEPIDAAVTFSTSNAAVVSVSNSGLAKAEGPTGTATITASAGGISSAGLQLQVIAGAAAAVVPVTSLAGSVAAGSNQPVSVKVVDAAQNAVPGASVTFAASSGATVSGSSSVLTDASGVASATLGIATAAGTSVAASATATGLTGSPIAFSSTVVAAAAQRLAFAVDPSSAAQSRIPLTTQPVLRVEDSFGNPVASSGRTVTASVTGGGLLDGTTTQTTTTAGAASFSGLAIRGLVGTKTLTFASTGLVSASKQVTLSAGAPATLAISAGNNQIAYVGTAVTTAPAVSVQDADANPVAGVPVTFAVTTGGGSVTSSNPSSSASGIAAVGSWTLGGSAFGGANDLTATSTALPSASAVFAATAWDPPTSCGETAFLTIGRRRDANLKASQCVITSSTRLGGPSFTGPQAGGTLFYDLYLIDIPANTIMSIAVTRGSLTSGETILGYTLAGTYVDRGFLQPLVINNSSGATVRYQIVVSHIDPGTTGTYTIRATTLVGGTGNN